MKRGYKLINAEGVTKARYTDLLTRIDAESAKGSTGAFGKLAEANIRAYLNTGKRGGAYMRKADFRARTMKSDDCTVKLNGKACKVEIKTGCGDLSYNVEGVVETELLPKADFVVWIPLTKGVNDDNFPRFSYVFTRAEFIDLLYAMGSVKKVKGEYIVPEHCDKLNVRYVPARRHTQIATFDTCTGKLAVLYDTLDSTPTLEQWVEKLNSRA